METGQSYIAYDPQNNPDLFTRHPEYYDEKWLKNHYENMSPETRQLVSDLFEGLKEVSNNQTTFIQSV